LDILCKPADCPTILAHFRARGHRVEIEDHRWRAKVFDGDNFFDVIFASRLGNAPVSDQWFKDAPLVEVFGTTVRVIAPTELIWSKAFVQLRHRYDGADIINLILRRHQDIDWARLLAHMDLQWEVLLAHLVNFRWAYPSERDHIPRWLMAELARRLAAQLDRPPPPRRVCRGRMFSEIDYEAAINDWGFADVGHDEAGNEHG
jgi:hypothetical protein